MKVRYSNPTDLVWILKYEWVAHLLNVDFADIKIVYSCIQLCW